MSDEPKAKHDARCLNWHCNRRVCWTGTPLDRPPCPWCRHRPSDESITAAAEYEARLKAERKARTTEAGQDFGRYVRTKRLEKGYSLADTAAAVGVGVPVMSSVENGANLLHPDQKDALLLFLGRPR